MTQEVEHGGIITANSYFISKCICNLKGSDVSNLSNLYFTTFYSLYNEMEEVHDRLNFYENEAIKNGLEVPVLKTSRSLYVS